MSKLNKRTTIYDIARKLNIAASSVSRALNDKGHINDAKRKIIQKTASEMNYNRNSLASNLRQGRSKTIGVVVPYINQNFFANVIAGIEDVAYQKGYSLIICQSYELESKEVKCIHTLINQSVDCIVISIAADSSNSSHLQKAIDHGIVLIQFDRVWDELETLKVINDNMEASFEAVSHLVEQGYRRIALLEGPQNLDIFRHRKAGYLKALEKYQIPVIEELMIANAWTKELGAKATRELLNLKEPPDAIFASTSDFSALGVLEVAAEKNIPVPAALGICGYSNEDFTEITSPSITTIDQFSVPMGRTVASLYFQEMDRKGDAVAHQMAISIKPRLIIRKSTRKKA